MRTSTRKTTFQLESLEYRRLLSALTVSSAADSGIGSLRAQIAAAQSGDSISFAPSLAGQTITLTSGVLTIAKSLTIQGLGANQLTISGNVQSRVFKINGSTNQVAIRDLTITQGLPANGGAISNSATLTVSGCTLSRNITYIQPWAATAAPSTTPGLTVSNSTLSGNIALQQLRRQRRLRRRHLQLRYADGQRQHPLWEQPRRLRRRRRHHRQPGTLTVSGSTLSGNSAA